MTSKIDTPAATKIFGGFCSS